MFGGIRHVVSESDEMGANHGGGGELMEGETSAAAAAAGVALSPSQQQQQQQHPQQQSPGAGFGVAPNVVEQDVRMMNTAHDGGYGDAVHDVAPLSLIQSRARSTDDDDVMSSSSLSDDNDDDVVDDNDDNNNVLDRQQGVHVKSPSSGGVDANEVMSEDEDEEMTEAHNNNNHQQQQDDPSRRNASDAAAAAAAAASAQFVQSMQQQQHHQQQQNQQQRLQEQEHAAAAMAAVAAAAAHHHHHHHVTYERMDSAANDSSSGSQGRASSQNSSRDWGWFEDVHQSVHDAELQQKQAAAGGGAGHPNQSSMRGAGTNNKGKNNNSKSTQPHHPLQSGIGSANAYGPGGSRGTGQQGGGGMLAGGGTGAGGNRHGPASGTGPSPSDNHNNPSNSNTKKARGVALVPQVSGGEVHELALLNPNKDETDAAVMAVTAPTYVLEESLSSQRLWKNTAGNRPPQPVEERAFYEKMWAQNFARSQVQYDMPVEVLTATSPISLSPFADGNFVDNDASGPGYAEDMTNYNLKPQSGQAGAAEEALVSRIHDHSQHHMTGHQQIVNRRVRGVGSDGDLIVLVRGDNVFGTTVSKSFARPSAKGGPIVGVDTVNISIASYRVIESKKHGKYAQFLVIYREGSIRDTIGVWKRYSDFEELARKVTHAHEGCSAVIANMSPLAVAEEPETEHLPNAITSWRLLKKRQRWYRCLDAGYLSLKVFLLERFLHDILFESSSPKLLREFVGNEAVC